MFLLLGLFTVEVTLAYIFVTLLAAIVGGLVIGRFDLNHLIKDVQVTSGSRTITTDGGTSQCCESPAVPDRSHRERFTTAGHGALEFFRDTVAYLLLGIVIGALIYGAVPESLLQSVAGTTNPLVVVFAVLLGAPVYVSISGMLPIAAALAAQGVPIGTVLAFVIGGAGISIPNLILLNALFERKLLAVYASAVVVIGFTVGMIFNLFFVGMV